MAVKKSKRKVRSKNVLRRLWQERLLSWWRWVVLGIVFIPIIGAGFGLFHYLFRSDTFFLKNIIVDGNQRVQNDKLVSVLDIGYDQLIFTVNINRLSQKLMGEPMIEYAVVRRVLPDTLVINVRERKPFLWLKYYGKYYEVDFSGVVLQEKELVEIPEKPIINGAARIKGGIVLGAQIQEPRVVKAIDIMHIVNESDISAVFHIDQINIRNMKQIVLVTRNGVKIQLGADQFAEKLHNLSVLMKEKPGDVRKANYIDLRFGGVILRPRRL